MPTPSLDNSDTDIREILATCEISARRRDEGDRSRRRERPAALRAHCTSCHRVTGSGGPLGPDLSRIGGSRSRALLTREIRDASRRHHAGFQPVTLVTKDGKRIRGVKKNEDAYSIQIMDTRERLQGYIKADLREVIDG